MSYQFLKETISQTYTELLFKRDSCSSKDASSQKCEKPSTISGGELAATICVPVVVVALVLGGLAFKSYRDNKKEQKEFENDPEFYKNDEEFITVNDMPVYPPPAYNNHNMLNNDSTDNLSTKGSVYPPSMNTPYNGGSRTASTLNPFGGADDRYPSAVNSNNASTPHQ
ncbi:hypothetical protein DASC09_050090 [Saccharomycopsis crataegensis]|uniref:Uncharacterized protein n=1 Tax=Saccharomycopsis crataegensis TaxID=43959 RepID=A0AAV5QSF2_9ASCO|nr:hypothetical protein DASC09_050090 [Saccharomycopsis crataegensis]